MANTENIEAKLCAYVDGELDAAGRAEIEAHLAANPQHRQLIDELRGQRDLLRDLPRAAAPGDLLESVHSQLERSALLDGVGGEGDRAARDIAGRISPWPRIISVAAVLTMAIGLFAVIYYVLPQNSARLRRGEYASDTATNRTPSGSRFSTTDRSFPALTTAPTGAMAELDKDLARSKDAKVAEADTRADKRAADAIARDDTAGAVGGAAAPATHPDIFAKGGQMDEAKAGDGTAGFTNIFADTETEEKLKRSADVPSNSLVMVVASADPSQAQGQVQKYLDNNKITWTRVTEPVPQMDLKDSQVMSGSRLGSTQMRLKGGGSSETFAAKGGGGSSLKQEAKQGAQEDFAQTKKETATEVRQQQQQPQQQIALAPTGSPPPSPSTPNVASNAAPAPVYDLTPAAPAVTAPAKPAQEAEAARKAQTHQQLTLNPESPAPAAAAAPSPALAPAQAEQQVDAQSQQPQAQQQIVLQQQQQQAPMSQAGGSPPQLIVARGLTRRQVSELNSNLATQNAGRVYNYRRSGDNFTPTTLPAATTSPAALALTVSRNDIEATEPAAAVPGAAATTQPAAPASPVSPARELKANSTKSTDQFGTNDNTTAATTMPALVATTGPVAQQKQFDALLKSDQSSTTRPAAETAAIAAPTSQPASIGAGTVTVTGATTMAMGPTTHASGDERLDVVICIQPPGVIAGQVREINGANGAAGTPAATQPLIAPDTAASEPAPNETPPSDSNDSEK